MADPNVKLDRLITRSGEIENLYIRQFLTPLSSSLTAARESYTKTLAAQQKADDLKAEIAITLLFVAGSVAFAAAAPAAGALFGTTAVAATKRLGSVGAKLSSVSKTATDALSNRTLVKFAWSSLTKEAKSFMKKQATNQAKALNDGLGKITLNSTHPAQIHAASLAQLNSLFNHKRAVLRAVRDGSGTDAEKLDFAAQTERTPFFRASGTLAQKLDILERQFELLMYMHFVLDRDHMSTLTSSGMGGMAVTKGARIDTMPRDPKYPTTKSSSGFGYSTITGPDYEDVGNIIAGRINDLYTAEFLPSRKSVYEWIDDDFRWGQTNTSKNQLMKAQGVLEKLTNLTSYKKNMPVWN